MKDQEIAYEILKAVKSASYAIKDEGPTAGLCVLYPGDKRISFLKEAEPKVLRDIFYRLRKEETIELFQVPLDMQFYYRGQNLFGQDPDNLTAYVIKMLKNFDSSFLRHQKELNLNEKEIINSKLEPNISLTEYKNKYSIYLKASSKSDNTIKKYLSEINKLIAYLGENAMPENINIEIINDYLVFAKANRKLGSNSYSKLVIILKGFLEFLIRKGFLNKDITENLKIPKSSSKEAEFLTDEEIEKIEYCLSLRKENYKAEKQRDKLVFYLGLYCGMRKSEIIKLNWQDINLDSNLLNIINSKGGKSRKVKFSDKVKELLREYKQLANDGSQSVVRGNFGKRISSCSLQNLITSLFRNSGVERKGLTLHSLRHTYAVKQVQKGTDMHTIKELLGHSSLATTDKYLHLLSRNLDNAILE